MGVGDTDIGRLQVAMDNTALMCDVKRIANLDESGNKWLVLCPCESWNRGQPRSLASRPVRHRPIRRVANRKCSP